MAIDMGGTGNGDSVTAQQIDAVRRFNRFYTVELGILDQGLLDSPLSLTEVRVLYELFHRGQSTAADLGKQLRLDPGYLSRILRRFQQRGWLKRQPSASDRRQVQLRLTRRGQRAFAALDRRSRDQIAALLGRCTTGDQSRMVGAMEAIERALAPSAARGAGYVVRQHQPGDLGWIAERHGALYRGEYGLDERFEALVARIAADFIERFDGRREACWIAERDGANVGCVCLVQSRDDATHEPLPGVAQLRLLLVEPSARGLGLGRRLVAECTRFAHQAGYERIRLWTNSVLSAARRIYENEGYSLVASEAHRSFGQDLVGETWELELGGAKR